jgi:hypothetical protein
MKLPVKKIYFDEMKKGNKRLDCRDAHITFVCEETGERLVKRIKSSAVIDRPENLYPDVLSDDRIIVFEFE